MVRVTSSFMAIALIVTIALASPVCAKTAKDCITIVHIGSQDRPLGSVRMCPGERGKSHAVWILGNDWEFEFETEVFKRIEAYVKKHGIESAIDQGMIPFGTFRVEYGPQTRRIKQIVSKPAICSYLAQVAGLVPQKIYGEFHRVLADILSRLRCSSVSPSEK